jgi:hypothetical protein
MSHDHADNFAHFYRQVLDDLSLQEDLRALDDGKEFVARVVELGAENGFIFTAEDVQETIHENNRAWIERWI